MPTHAERQELIDTLFDKLEATDQPGSVNQLTHALRVQITAKRKVGQALDARENAIIAAVGSIGPQASGPGLFTWLVVLAILAAAAYGAWRWLNPA
jgi:hypothetical protein